jgi:hypothetical protein
MALSAKIKTLVQQAIRKVDDLAPTITYVQQVVGAYDPVTDTRAFTTTTYSNVPAVLVGLSEEDVEWWPADMIGQKALIAYNDLPIDPDDSDHVLIGSVRWTIYRIKKVPGNSLFIIYLREP